MNVRRETPREKRAYKTLFRVLVEDLGGLEAAAACCRVGRSQLADYYALGSEAFAPIDVVADLEEARGEPVVTAELARQRGYSLLPIEARGDGELNEGVAKLGREMNEVFVSFVEAEADGKQTIDEIDIQIREHQDVVRQANANIATLIRMRRERT